MYEYKARCIRVIDGDTAELDIDAGLYVHVHETCRLFGLNAPEMKLDTRPAGEAAKAYLASLIDGAELIVQTLHDKRCKYGRFLVVIWKDGVNVNEAMVQAGHAVLYGEGM